MDKQLSKQRIETENCKTNLAVLKQTQTSMDDLLNNMTYVSLQVIANEALQKLLSQPDITERQRSNLINSVKYDVGALLTSKEYISSLSIFDQEHIYVQFGKYLLDKPITNLEKTQEKQGRILWSSASICGTYAFQKDRSYENSMSRTIISHDNYQQVLAFERISVEEDYLCSLYSGIADEGTECVFIMDRKGSVVSSNDKTMLNRSVAGKEYFSKVRQVQEGYFF